ncbi:hypothetical protein ABB02_00451 [Clostridiaceae bacterium JG1575]|nr:hypothetical protein ABB02_00451 [Clostridiaceae bacterium JG1575]
MDYVVLDLEFNNMQGVLASLNDYLSRQNAPRRHQYPNEIIQIGAVRLNKDFDVVEELNLIVRNSFYKTLNPYISLMTGITQEQMDEGVYYPEAMERLAAFSEGAALITWGLSDLLELIRNAHMHQLPMTIMGTRYLDLQQWMMLRSGAHQTPSLKGTLDALAIQVDETLLHDGFYDAKATALVLEAAARRYGPLDGFKNSAVLFGSDCVVIHGIRVRDIPDGEITMRCPLCGAEISYDQSLTPTAHRIHSMYHCNGCSSQFMEELSVKENMTGERTYFKKIRKISQEHYGYILAQRRQKRQEEGRSPSKGTRRKK